MQSHARHLWVDAWKRFTCLLPLTRHRSTGITANAAACPAVQESRDGRLQTTRDTPEGVEKPSRNQTELSSPFNRKPHVTDQDFTKFNMNANHFQLLDGKCRLLCGPAKYLCGPVAVRGPAVENHWPKSISWVFIFAEF